MLLRNSSVIESLHIEKLRLVIVKIFVPIALLLTSAWAHFFPIGGYRCERLDQADSCNMNMVLFYGGVFGATRFDSVETLLNQADDLGMKVILTRAQRPGTSDINTMSHGQRFVYECESDFDHRLGQQSSDFDAENDLTWVVRSTKAGWFQHGLFNSAQRQLYKDSTTYYALFRLKIDNAEVQSPICTLLVRETENGGVIQYASRGLVMQNFPEIGVYDTFALKFRLTKSTGRLDYAIWYTGTNTRIYCDRVEVMDTIAYALRMGLFDDDIKTITTYYNEKQTIYRYYMWDEPQPSQFWASSEVNRLLKQYDEYRGGIQAVCRKDLLHAYLDIVNTDELFVDFYPLNGGNCAYSFHYVPVDSGTEFQGRIDDMCDFLGDARNAVSLHPTKKLWFIPQTFGQGLSSRDSTWAPWWNNAWLHDSATTGWWREPSPRELTCMVWLALAYGAKGICYYIYHSNHHYFSMPKWGQYVWDIGLTNSSGDIKRPIWTTVRSINSELKKIGPLLAGLKSDTVFKSDRVPQDCFIKTVEADLLQIGTFHDASYDYFIIVNRNCLPEESLEAVVSIDRDNLQYLRDCYNQEMILPEATMGSSAISYFKIKLAPGQGKLFCLHP
jgi:hypothetical protein